MLTPEFAAHPATLTNTRLLADPVAASRKILVEFANDQIERYLKGELLENVIKPGAAR